MKLVKAFFVMLHLQLVVPLVLLVIESVTSEKTTVISYIASALGVLFFITIQVIGWICAVLAFKMFMQSQTEQLSKAWILLKIKTIPFYILNFVVCFMVGFGLSLATAGLLSFIIILMIIHTCTFIVQSGFFGAANIILLRRKYGKEQISAIHYFLQFISVLDVFSTIILLRKTKNLNTASAEQIEATTE